MPKTDTYEALRRETVRLRGRYERVARQLERLAANGGEPPVALWGRDATGRPRRGPGTRQWALLLLAAEGPVTQATASRTIPCSPTTADEILRGLVDWAFLVVVDGRWMLTPRGREAVERARAYSLGPLAQRNLS